MTVNTFLHKPIFEQLTDNVVSTYLWDLNLGWGF